MCSCILMIMPFATVSRRAAEALGRLPQNKGSNVLLLVLVFLVSIITVTTLISNYCKYYY